MSCLYPQYLSLSGLAQWLLRNARVCKSLERTDMWLKHEFAVQSYADELNVIVNAIRIRCDGEIRFGIPGVSIYPDLSPTPYPTYASAVTSSLLVIV